MKKIILPLIIFVIILSACGAQEVTPTKEVSVTQAATKTPQPAPTVEAPSSLGVKKEALNGLEIKVWHPWYGVESGRFDTFVEDFNQSNEWGIKVVAESQVNFTNLYENVSASQPTADRPDLVIALPEHALEWDTNGMVTDLTQYVNDPAYGIDASNIPVVFWNQDRYGEERVGLPAQRTARFLLWNETWRT